MSRASLSLTLGCFLFATPGTLLAQWRSDNTIFTSGNLKITRHQERVEDEILPRLSFQRDRIMFGDCIDDAKYRRMPMTYYAPQGPLGMVLQKFNWFPGPANTYYADARLPASLVAQGFPIGLESLLSQLGVVWSEPPVAVLGMEIGTPASYARPFQQFHFFEPTKAVIDVSDGKEKRFFHYIPDARARGAAISIFHGSPRQQLAKHGPRKYYHLMILEACSGESGEKPSRTADQGSHRRVHGASHGRRHFVCTHVASVCRAAPHSGGNRCRVETLRPQRTRSGAGQFIQQKGY